MNEEVYLTAAQLAKRLGVCREKVYYMAAREQLPCMKLGGSWRFQQSAIERWLASNTVEPQSDRLR